MARTQWPAWNPNSFARDSRCLMTLMMLRFQAILVFPRISSYRIAPLSLFCRHLHTPFSIVFPSFNSWVEAHMVQKCSEWWVHVARLQHVRVSRPKTKIIGDPKRPCNPLDRKQSRVRNGGELCTPKHKHVCIIQSYNCRYLNNMYIYIGPNSANKNKQLKKHNMWHKQIHFGTHNIECIK